MSLSDPLAVLRRHWFPDLPADHVGPPLGGGLSGSPVYAVRDVEGVELVLKAFAERATVEQAVFVHELVDHLAAAGLPFIPRLVAARSHASTTAPVGRSVRPRTLPASLVRDHGGRLWELAVRMPGHPLTHPAPTQLAAAMRALARIHAAAARMPAAMSGTIVGGAVPASGIGPAPALIRRIEAAARMVASPWEALRAIPAAGDTDPLRRTIGDRLEAVAPLVATPSVRRWLQSLATARPPVMELLPAVRDLRASHVLFHTPAPSVASTGDCRGAIPPGGELDDTVGGVVDFHAAGIDTPATDIARLLGDWVAVADCEDRGVFSAGVASALVAYREERPLSCGEEQRVPWLIATAVVFGLDQWFRWILVEQRRFAADRGMVVARVERLAALLAAALETLLERGPLV
ncbi:MAG: phosphotransferase [Planctomycetaceae bacterium]